MLRKLEQLNLMDDFLFGSVLSYPEIGENFCRKLLKILLGVDLETIRVIPQKVYYGSDTDQHGTRLDVYIEEDGEAGAVFDVEPDKNDSEHLRKALPRRIRFYHSKIDGRSLKSGDDYSKLKRVLVIMITSYDPFGKDRILYTIRSGCVEEPDMEYDDGAETLFFYTKGKVGNVSEEVRKLLNYMEKSCVENAVSDALQEIHRMVEIVRYDKEVSLEYMKAYEHDIMMQERGKREGKSEGKREEETRIVRKLSHKSMAPEEIAELLELDVQYVKRIVIFLEEYPEESDEQIARRITAGDADSCGRLQQEDQECAD